MYFDRLHGDIHNDGHFPEYIALDEQACYFRFTWGKRTGVGEQRNLTGCQW
jgi:hypothetical protein